MGALAERAYVAQAPMNGCRSAGPHEQQCSAQIRGDYHAHYVIHTNPAKGEQIVAIRGTAAWDDVRADLDTNMVQDPHLLVKVHSGFHKYAQAVFADVVAHSRLDRKYRTYITGHSLGGAAALLVGLYLYVDKVDYQVEGVYTFGQPKVFDNEGTTSWPFFSRRVFRVVDCADVVPIVPTGEAAFDNIFRLSIFGEERLRSYQHMGQSLLLMDRGRFWMPGQIELERDLPDNIKSTLASLVGRRPLDHGIAHYRARLRDLPGELDDSLVVNPDRTFPCSKPSLQSAAN
jgi:hypothetical protein